MEHLKANHQTTSYRMSIHGLSALVEFVHGRLTVDESLDLLESLEGDSNASAVLDLVVDLLNEANDPTSTVFIPETSRGQSFLVRNTKKFLLMVNRRPLAFACCSFALVLTTIVTVLYANLHWTNKFDELIAIDKASFEWNVRGDGEADLATAYQFFNQSEFDKSLALLKRYVRTNSHCELVEYAQYAAGAVCLISSRERILGLFTSQNNARINEGLDHLSTAIGLTSKRRLLEEARFLKAKAFLMLSRPELAIGQLDSLRMLDGARRNEASQMIKRIQALTPP